MRKMTGFIMSFLTLITFIGSSSLSVKAVTDTSAAYIRSRDFNQDGIIDIHDIAQLANHYNNKTGQATWNAIYDLNSDGVTDLYDLVKVSQSIGTVLANSVALTENTVSLNLGETHSLSASVAPLNATDKAVTWTSSNPQIASVDSTGKVTGVSEGTAIITVITEDGSKTASCTVTVTKKTSFAIGETAVINDRLYGKYELTIYKVEAVSERNSYSSINPAEVYKITYRYKLLSKGTSTNGLWIDGFDSAFDSTGAAGQDYPDSRTYHPEKLKIVGTSSTAETFIAVMNPTDKLTLTRDFYASSGTDFVTFNVPTKSNNIMNPPVNTGADISLPSTTYGLGNTANVTDRLYGNYEFTVNKVEVVSQRNQFSDIVPADVYKITYTYRLLANGTSTNGLWIDGFDSAFDNTGEAGHDYPDTRTYYPQTLKISGTSCTAETFISVSNVTDKLILTLDFYASSGTDFVTFVIPTGKDSNLVTFTDTNLEAVVRNTISKPTGDINKSDVAGITSLTYYGKNAPQIYNLGGIENLTNLTELSLRANSISDISPLRTLTNLKSLDLYGNSISNISALSGLTSLTSLDLSVNNVSDISVLSGLTNLTNVNLFATKVTNVTPLSSLTNLDTLDLSYNQIVYINALSGLTKLKSLRLMSTSINNTNALMGLTNLELLDLYSDNISDISALTGLTNLKDLDIFGTNISYADYQVLKGILPDCTITY